MAGGLCVLVAEADEARRADLLFAAMDEAITLDAVATAAEAVLRLTAPPADRAPYAAAILALDLPDGDGFSLIARLRAGGVCIPLLLAGDTGIDNVVVRALDAGASDVIDYPFRPAILRARLRAQLRGFAAAARELPLGGYRLDIENRTLRDLAGNRTTRLTGKEADLLRYLHRAAGRPVGRAELLREVWGYSSRASSHTVATHIHRLRRKIEADGCRLLASDERGYRLAPAPPLPAPPLPAPPLPAGA